MSIAVFLMLNLVFAGYHHAARTIEQSAKWPRLVLGFVSRPSSLLQTSCTRSKIPGRPIFGKMLEKIEKGEANGILAWHEDRLARNSVDGGRIIYLLDCGHIQSLKFPTLWFENTPQGKFMLNIVFGQSKYEKIARDFEPLLVAWLSARLRAERL